MTPAHLLLWAGVACILLSAAALVRFRTTFTRLHALAGASCLGVPLIAVSVALQQDGRALIKTLLIGALYAVGGTAGTNAIGKAAREAGEEREP